MKKMTIISSSNRMDNKTKIFSESYSKLLKEQGIESMICNLEQFPSRLLGQEMYDFNNQDVLQIVEKYLEPVDKLIFIVPEYNGSFPGILKLFIDSIRPQSFNGKKAALVGISAGRSGNVRGMDHLTGILNYLKVNVHHHKLPIASIDSVLNAESLIDVDVQRRLNLQIKEFLEF